MHPFQSVLVCWSLECQRSLLNLLFDHFHFSLIHGHDIPVSYYCSLQHRTLLLSPVISTTGYCFCFGSIPSFFLELFFHWSPVAYWAPTDLGSSSFSILSFCLLILFMGFARQEYWRGLPFPSQVDHILSSLSTMTCLSWVAPRAWLSFIDLDKSVVLVWLDWLVFCEYGFSVSALWCPLTTPTIFLLPWRETQVRSLKTLKIVIWIKVLFRKNSNCVLFFFKFYFIFKLYITVKPSTDHFIVIICITSSVIGC